MGGTIDSRVVYLPFLTVEDTCTNCQLDAVFFCTTRCDDLQNVAAVSRTLTRAHDGVAPAPKVTLLFSRKSSASTVREDM